MHRNGGPVYTISISGGALSTAGSTSGTDVLGIKASTSGHVEIMSIKAQLASTQYTTHPGLGVSLLRGSTADSTGAAITPVPVKGHTAAPAAAFSVTGICTALVPSTAAKTLYAGAFDANGSFEYCPEECARPNLILSQRLHLRVTQPSVAAVVNLTVTVRDTGLALPA